MRTIPAPLVTASITFLIVFFYFYTAFRVGNIRGRLNIKAPATTGHPEFERAYRVQLNTLEQMGIFLPLFWLCAFYPIGIPWIAPLIGILWLFGRVLYLWLYTRDPDTRVPAAMIGGVTSLAILITALWGLVDAWRVVA